jgi:murein L,D-transpeptidase YcbB/YkuD
VQQIFPLASLALTDDAAEGMDRLNQVVKSRETQRLALDNPLPVYFLYWTALAGADGKVGFRPDIYGRDAPLIARLTKAGNGTAMSESEMRAAPRVLSGPPQDEEPSP